MKKSKKRTIPPDPKGQNDVRAEWAEWAIIHFKSMTHTDDEHAVMDLLCDLMHWCDRHSPDTNFATHLVRAARHYADETKEETQ
jgi:hypothetical protein